MHKCDRTFEEVHSETSKLVKALVLLATIAFVPVCCKYVIKMDTYIIKMDTLFKKKNKKIIMESCRAT